MNCLGTRKGPPRSIGWKSQLNTAVQLIRFCSLIGSSQPYIRNGILCFVERSAAVRARRENTGRLSAIVVTPFVLNHPLLNDVDNALHIGLHGDAGAFTKHDSLMVVSWNGLLGTGTTRPKRFVLTFVRKADYTAATLDRIWELLAWSVNAMARGETPSLDWDGKPLLQPPSALAGPYTGILTQVRGAGNSMSRYSSSPPLERCHANVLALPRIRLNATPRFHELC